MTTKHNGSLVGSLFLLAINSTILMGSDRITEDPRAGYLDSLNSIVKILKAHEIPSDNLIAFVIPMTQKENKLYVRIDYNKDSEMAFHKLIVLILQRCLSGDKCILKNHILYSEFTDGYLADEYFDNFNEIIKKQGKSFCEIYKTLPQKKVLRLKDVFDMNCK